MVRTSDAHDDNPQWASLVSRNRFQITSVGRGAGIRTRDLIALTCEQRAYICPGRFRLGRDTPTPTTQQHVIEKSEWVRLTALRSMTPTQYWGSARGTTTWLTLHSDKYLATRYGDGLVHGNVTQDGDLIVDPFDPDLVDNGGCTHAEVRDGSWLLGHEISGGV